MTRTQLLEHVWDVNYGGVSNVVDVYVGYLRRKLADAGARAEIRTVRGVGYALEEEPMSLPIRAKITLWFTALLTVILVGGAAFVVLDLQATQTAGARPHPADERGRDRGRLQAHGRQQRERVPRHHATCRSRGCRGTPPPRRSCRRRAASWSARATALGSTPMLPVRGHIGGGRRRRRRCRP